MAHRPPRGAAAVPAPLGASPPRPPVASAPPAPPATPPAAASEPRTERPGCTALIWAAAWLAALALVVLFLVPWLAALEPKPGIQNTRPVEDKARFDYIDSFTSPPAVQKQAQKNE